MKRLFSTNTKSKWYDNAMNPPVEENCLTIISKNNIIFPEGFKEELKSIIPNKKDIPDDMPDTLAYNMQVLGKFISTDK